MNDELTKKIDKLQDILNNACIYGDKDTILEISCSLDKLIVEYIKDDINSKLSNIRKPYKWLV